MRNNPVAIDSTTSETWNSAAASFTALLSIELARPTTHPIEATENVTAKRFVRDQDLGFIGSLGPSYPTTKTLPSPPSCVLRRRTSMPVRVLPRAVPWLCCVVVLDRVSSGMCPCSSSSFSSSLSWDSRGRPSFSSLSSVMFRKARPRSKSVSCAPSLEDVSGESNSFLPASWSRCCCVVRTLLLSSWAWSVARKRRYCKKDCMFQSSAKQYDRLRSAQNEEKREREVESNKHRKHRIHLQTIVLLQTPRPTHRPMPLPQPKPSAVPSVGATASIRNGCDSIIVTL
jgi:hypothetical protein